MAWPQNWPEWLWWENGIFSDDEVGWSVRYVTLVFEGVDTAAGESRSGCEISHRCRIVEEITGKRSRKDGIIPKGKESHQELHRYYIIGL